MAELTTWMFQQQKKAMEALVQRFSPKTGVVQLVVPGTGKVVILDQESNQVESEELMTLGDNLQVGERVLVVPLGDGSRAVQRIGLPPGRAVFSGHIQAARAIFLSTSIPLGALSTFTVTANRVYYVPIWVPKPTTVSSLIFEMTVTVSGIIVTGFYDSSDTLLPTTRMAQGPTSQIYGAAGWKTQTFTAMAIPGQRWYFAAVACKVAPGLRGSQIGANLPSPRGGSSATGDAFCIAFEDLAAGWTDLPAVASPSSGPTNTYVHVGVGT